MENYRPEENASGATQQQNFDGANQQQNFNGGAQQQNFGGAQQQNFNGAGQQPNPGMYNQMPPVAPAHNLAVATLVCGISGFFFCGAGIAAIVFGIIAKRDGNNESIRTAGFALGIISSALSILAVIAYLVFVVGMFAFIGASEAGTIDF